MNSLRDIRIFLGLVPKESSCISFSFRFAPLRSVVNNTPTTSCTAVLKTFFFAETYVYNFSFFFCHVADLAKQATLRFQ
jgi:hypothetical protein